MIAHHQICIVELPPRARRIRWGLVCYVQAGGTTSACAENTKPVKTSNPNPRNYLRVRGEYPPVRSWQPPLRELPPRARRILLGVCIRWGVFGTTSACAENTPRLKTATRPPWNYLRVRGEYKSSSESRGITAELPPRARRIRQTRTWAKSQSGTTSACAENTTWVKNSSRAGMNYLRVRGEYLTTVCIGEMAKELPPRARRIPKPRLSQRKL